MPSGNDPDFETKAGDIIGLYQDVVSGAKAARPGLNRLMEDTSARKFDVLPVWKLDRFGRSLVDCLNNIHDVASGSSRSPRSWILMNGTLHPSFCSTSSGQRRIKRSLIRERTLAGQQRYRTT
jgi:DNA invertase Pin-like site-specific DNA recombinase